MSTPLVIVFPRGQLAAKDKERLTKAGVIAVEADDPTAVHQVRLVAPLICGGISGDMLVQAALLSIAGQPPATDGGSITTSGKSAHAFIKHLAAAMTAPTAGGMP